MVIAIHVGPKKGGPLESVSAARAVAGHGLESDRNFHHSAAGPGDALTLVEDEVVEDIGLAPGRTRRQLTVRGVRLNGLVGKRFTVGEVECYGVELCEPCLHLQKMTRPGLIKDLVHRGGLRADILSDGVIAIGDEIKESERE
jgi:MOSC domain-containing protein YiiM